ncbi:phage protease [Desulfovibrio sp. SGI.169]|uniref:phage protease n=1 Tax=Desulfovibrio sp. SGI.169 TaxID=3420561 RepID=UPI003D084259
MGKEKWIEIARTGTFEDSAGRLRTFTARDLDAIARRYDPARRDAPLTFGHPDSDRAPAYGWVEKLKSEGGKLYANFSRVPEQVRDLVAKGHYRHVSMSLMPDLVTLRHVALLGAEQPAIDGLAAVEFADGGDAITVDFATQKEGDTMSEDLQREIGALKERIKSLETENAALKQQAQSHKEGKDKAEAEKAAAQEKAEKASADFAAYRGRIEGERREARVSELVKAGKVKPAEKAGVLDFAARLATQTETVNFSAPDGKTESLTMEERYFRDLEARPADERGADFSAPPAHAGHAGGQFDNFNPAELTAKL